MCLAISPAPKTGSPRPFGPRTPEESEKSPGKSTPGQNPKECTPQSQKESESQVLDSSRTLLRLRGALFRDSGPGVPLPKTPSFSFRSPFRLFRGSGPEGPGRSCVGGGADRKICLFCSGTIPLDRKLLHCITYFSRINYV